MYNIYIHVVWSVAQWNRSWYNDRYFDKRSSKYPKSWLYVICRCHFLSFLDVSVSICLLVSQSPSDFCICLFHCFPFSLIFSMYGWYRTHLLVTCLRSFAIHCDNFMWSLKELCSSFRNTTMWQLCMGCLYFFLQDDIIYWIINQMASFD